MIISDLEFHKLPIKQKALIYEAMNKIDYKSILKFTLICFLFIHPFSSIIAQGAIWNLLFWHLPFDRIAYHMEGRHWIMILESYLTGYFITFWIIHILNKRRKINAKTRNKRRSESSHNIIS